MDRFSKWVDENTAEDAVFYTQRYDAFLVRVFIQRPVFIDWAFPFDESYIAEFGRRYAIKKSVAKAPLKAFYCLAETEKLDYVIRHDSYVDPQYYDQAVFNIPSMRVYDVRKPLFEAPCAG